MTAAVKGLYCKEWKLREFPWPLPIVIHHCFLVEATVLTGQQIITTSVCRIGSSLTWHWVVTEGGSIFIIITNNLQF